MLLKSVLILIVAVFLANASLPANDEALPEDQPSYVKLEVKGTLLLEGAQYYVETHDSTLASDFKLLVKLERSEDKNRLLDRHLEKLLGKPVVVKGYVDCRRIGQEAGVIYIYLSSESQVAAGQER